MFHNGFLTIISSSQNVLDTFPGKTGLTLCDWSVLVWIAHDFASVKLEHTMKCVLTTRITLNTPLHLQVMRITFAAYKWTWRSHTKCILTSNTFTDQITLTSSWRCRIFLLMAKLSQRGHSCMSLDENENQWQQIFHHMKYMLQGLIPGQAQVIFN